METIVGDAILIIIGNHDFLFVTAAFAMSVSLLLAVVQMWKYIERWRD